MGKKKKKLLNQETSNQSFLVPHAETSLLWICITCRESILL